MNRFLLLLLAASIGLSAHANYTVTTSQPLYPNGVYGYSGVQQPYNQAYNQGYNQNPYQIQPQSSYVNQSSYINPYQTGYQPGYQTGYGNTYQPYGYRANVPFSILNSAMTGVGTGAGSTGIIKNIGQSMLYSMMRGY